MPPDRQRITIIGTGCIGTSMGLALRQSPDAEYLEIVGHDREPGLARQAQKLGAFDRVSLNLHIALDGASLIILAVPLAAMREALTDVGHVLAPDAGVVVTDTAPLKATVIEWAETLLPPGNHFVGADPFLAPGTGGWEPLESLKDARADLFSRAVYAITARPEDPPYAVQAVANLAAVLGAQPLFMDLAEHDAIRVIVDAVPGILATALFRATFTAPGWADIRKAAGRSFATATAAVSGDAPSRRMCTLSERDALLRGLDAVLVHLETLRELITQGDAAVLESVFATTSHARDGWITESRERTWDTVRDSFAGDSLLRRTLRAQAGAVGKNDTGKHRSSRAKRR